MYLSVKEFKDKFFDFRKHQKKVKALQNLSEVENFAYQHHLDLIKLCMEKDFLEKEEADFLDFMLLKYNIDWKYWYHKSPYLKRIMHKRRLHRLEEEERVKKQLEFSFTRHCERESKKIPIHLLNKTKTAELRR